MTVDGGRRHADHACMEPETFEGGYPVEPYTEVISGLFQASAAPSPAQMLSMFDILIDVGGRDRWDLGRLHPPALARRRQLSLPI